MRATRRASVGSPSWWTRSRWAASRSTSRRGWRAPRRRGRTNEICFTSAASPGGVIRVWSQGANSPPQGVNSPPCGVNSPPLHRERVGSPRRVWSLAVSGVRRLVWCVMAAFRCSRGLAS
eukprot:1177304-Prorocentrum_minimum.AAC.1